MNLIKKEYVIIVTIMVVLAIAIFYSQSYMSEPGLTSPSPSSPLLYSQSSNGYNLITSRVINVNRTAIFDTMADIEKYPQILPGNFVSVTLVNKTKNIIFAEEEVSQLGITSTMLVKHTIMPYENHTLEVVSGDAQGTTITETFRDNHNGTTTLNTYAKLKLGGVLYPFTILAQSNLEHAMNTVIDHFVQYTITHSLP
jgi:ribosome-associated toxin RatA of RatAB toxin-antitoxin module